MSVTDLKNRISALAENGNGSAPPREEPRRTRWRLDELLDQPGLLDPPTAIVPRMAWKSRSTLFASREKRGKSTLVGYVSAQVSNGADVLGVPCTAGDVLIVGLEEFLGDIARRLKRFGANPKRVHIVDALSVTPAARVGEVRQHVTDTGATLVVIDTLMAYVSGGVTDANAAAQMEPFVQGLTRLARDTEAAVIIVGHGKKSDGSYRDSSSIGAAVDAIAEMTDEGTDSDLRSVKVRGRIPTADFSFRYDGTEMRLVSATDLSPANDVSTALGKVTAAQGKLAQEITDIVAQVPGASNKAIRDRSTARAADTDRMIAMLLKAGTIVDCGTERGHRYYLPEAAPTAMALDGGRPDGTTSGRPLGTTPRPERTTSGRGADDPRDDPSDEGSGPLVPPLGGRGTTPDTHTEHEAAA